MDMAVDSNWPDRSGKKNRQNAGGWNYGIFAKLNIYCTCETTKARDPRVPQERQPKDHSKKMRVKAEGARATNQEATDASSVIEGYNMTSFIHFLQRAVFGR